MKTLLPLVSWWALGLWFLADRGLHGGVSSQDVLAGAGIVVLGSADTLFFRRRGRAAENPSKDPRAQNVAATFTFVLFTCVLGLAGTLLEVLVRTRPEEGATALFAALLVHWLGAALFAAGCAAAAGTAR